MLPSALTGALTFIPLWTPTGAVSLLRLFWNPYCIPHGLSPEGLTVGVTQCVSVFQAKSYIQSLPQSPKKDFSQLFPRASPQGKSQGLSSTFCPSGQAWFSWAWV